MRRSSAFEQPSAAALRAELSEWVEHARDGKRLAQKLHTKIRDSVERMRAVRIRSNNPSQATLPAPKPISETLSRIVRADGRRLDDLPFAKLLEMIATGDLTGDDQVSLMGADFRRIREIDDLARHLLPSTTAVTGQLFEPGIPDYQALLRETSMLEVLARMRRQRETGVLFVERRDRTGSVQRKELYLLDGRLSHVASSDRAELLGEYLVRRGALTREQLDDALGVIARTGGRLGDTLIGLGYVEGVHVFRAIRDQGRDRVAAICGWPRGNVTLYRGTTPGHVEFPLDLDLASPMMAGAIVASRGNPRTLLPDGPTRIAPGSRHASTNNRDEIGTAPSSLRLVPELALERLTVDEALRRIRALRPGPSARVVGEREAAAALVASRIMDWVTF